jgi:hypothetical protein
MMTQAELKLECMKLGLALTSPSSANRHEEVVKLGNLLYSEIIAVEPQVPADTLVAEGRKKPGPKPKPRY